MPPSQDRLNCSSREGTTAKVCNWVHVQFTVGLIFIILEGSYLRTQDKFKWTMVTQWARRQSRFSDDQ